MRGFRMFAVCAFALVLAIGLSASVMAQGGGRPDFAGPAAKATGGIEVQEGANTAWVEFNAHEGDADHRGRGRQQAKGEFCWQLGDPEDPDRTICVDVVYVKVDGDTAWFAGPAVVDSADNLVGHWLFVMVVDGGTPATAGDEAWWQWLGEDAGDTAAEMVEEMDVPANEKTIVSGNLVVH